MTGWNRVVGHQDLITYIEQVVNSQKPANAYILSGDHGSGKTLLAELFARALLCEDAGEKPCMRCRSCRQATDHNHPDILYLTHEKPGSISVEEIRRQLVNTAAIRPYGSAYKVYIVDEAEKMTSQAQNALLKTLEEPPSYVVILLLAVDANALLPTIISRCVTLRLRGVRDSLVQKYLVETAGMEEEKAKICTVFARGSVGRALELANSEHFQTLLADTLHLLRYIDAMSVSEISAFVKEVHRHKEDVSELLDLMAVWYRDILLYKATGDANRLIFRREILSVQEKAKKSTYEGLENILEALKKAGVRLSANVSFDLTIELLALTIKEN